MYSFRDKIIQNIHILFLNNPFRYEVKANQKDHIILNGFNGLDFGFKIEMRTPNIFYQVLILIGTKICLPLPFIYYKMSCNSFSISLSSNVSSSTKRSRDVQIMCHIGITSVIWYLILKNLYNKNILKTEKLIQKFVYCFENK